MPKTVLIPPICASIPTLSYNFDTCTTPSRLYRALLSLNHESPCYSSVRPHHMLTALQLAYLTRPGLAAMSQVAIFVVISRARSRVVDLARYIYLVILPLCCCMAIAAPAPPNACRISAMLFTGSTTYIRYDLEGKGRYIGWADKSACLASAFALAFRVAIHFEQGCHVALYAFGGRHVC